MEKRHFELIAGSVARSRMATDLKRNSVKRNAAQAGIRLVAIDLAATLAHTNENFDRARFLAACGVDA